MLLLEQFKVLLSAGEPSSARAANSAILCIPNANSNVMWADALGDRTRSDTVMQYRNFASGTVLRFNAHYIP